MDIINWANTNKDRFNWFNNKILEWDKLKIALFTILVFLLLFAGYQIKTLTLNQNQNPSTAVETNVKESPMVNSNTPSFKNTIQQNIEDLKKEAGSINVEDLATSSPQVQKVINDLKSLQNLPQSRLKEACFKICNGL